MTFYTIKQVSDMTGIPSSTLRYYDKQGLLPGLTRRESGYRLFAESDLKMLQVLVCLKNSGLSIEEMKAFSKLVEKGDASLKERKALFETRRSLVLEQMRQIKKTLAVLDHKCAYYDKALAAGTEKFIKDCDVLPFSEEFLGTASMNARHH